MTRRQDTSTTILERIELEVMAKLRADIRLHQIALEQEHERRSSTDLSPALHQQLIGQAWPVSTNKQSELLSIYQLLANIPTVPTQTSPFADTAGPIGSHHQLATLRVAIEQHGATNAAMALPSVGANTTDLHAYVHQQRSLGFTGTSPPQPSQDEERCAVTAMLSNRRSGASEPNSLAASSAFPGLSPLAASDSLRAALAQLEVSQLLRIQNLLRTNASIVASAAGMRQGATDDRAYQMLRILQNLKDNPATQQQLFQHFSNAA